MANIAIIIAGGSGHRMGQDIPKQFINVYDKPVPPEIRIVLSLNLLQPYGKFATFIISCISNSSIFSPFFISTSYPCLPSNML